ncbi:GNAT family N-acetyltransferase [Rhodobacteraceae bacterium 2CG4]|uniref:GNAT family N-acetyltransferase n=1 Tax=Halovulum marinum TaxID=2662447 RepID=A0A6L5Z3B6_9RHOB|nr:GNAT family N-acetyltransferase [Halovulum marinum]MSU91038.1 GNAT family N-acetyltransferase [Halovulum marinum]
MTPIRRHGPDAAALGARIEASLLADLRASLPQATNTGFVLTAGPDDALEGGLAASASYGWLLIKALWVAPACRRTGLGRRLMARAEREGRASGCHSAWLDTSNPAARDFYLALGFTQFGRLENPPGSAPQDHRRWFLRKRLGAAAS